MLGDFLEPEGALYSGDEARRIIEPTRQLIAEMREHGGIILFTRCDHLPDDPEFQMWPRHCFHGSKGQEIFPELGAPLRLHRQ